MKQVMMISLKQHDYLGSRNTSTVECLTEVKRPQLEADQ